MRSVSAGPRHNRAALDAFGNPIDGTVGYARGRLLSNADDDIRRLSHAGAIVRARRAAGSGPTWNLTGNAARMRLEPADLADDDEWTAPAFVEDELEHLIVHHFGGTTNLHRGLALTRTSAAILAWILTHAGQRRPVLSIVPAGGRAHSSLQVSARAAGSPVIELDSSGLALEVLGLLRPSCAVITSVTSELEAIPGDELRRITRTLADAGCPTLLDDAYGSQIRPILLGGPRALELDVDAVVANADKAALGGPRCALVAGRSGAITRIAGVASMIGVDARLPSLLGARRALSNTTPLALIEDAAAGRALSDALAARLPDGTVVPGLLGPTIHEDQVLRLISEGATSPLVPSEASTAVAMTMLERFGAVTVNALSHPGARVSLRMKPTDGALDAAGGPSEAADAVIQAVEQVTRVASDLDAMSRILFG